MSESIDDIREDRERHRNEHECDSSPCDYNLNIYKAILIVRINMFG